MSVGFVCVCVLVCMCVWRKNKKAQRVRQKGERMMMTVLSGIRIVTLTRKLKEMPQKKLTEWSCIAVETRLLSFSFHMF